MPGGWSSCFARAVFALIVFAILLSAILIRPPKWLTHFDQSLYLTIAYDLNHHGVFSNGVLDRASSTVAAPPPGMFFAPVYPWLVVAATKIDGRFARAVDCSVEADRKVRDSMECEAYARPIHIMHAAFLAAGVLAIAFAAEFIFASSTVFWLAGGLATLALLPDADLFSFAMTESLTFALYSMAALSLVLALRAPRVRRMVPVGILFGLLCLTRPSFAVLAPVVIGLIVVDGLWLSPMAARSILAHALAFALAWLLVVGPWLVRNAISVGKWGLTEEYGSAALVERFAFDDMRRREFVLAFPYCLPGIGAPAVDWAFGRQAMARFVYSTPGSFFEAGRLHRERLLQAHGRLDPLIKDLIRDEMRQRGWRYLLTGLPLAWCGMWVGGLLGLALVPLFAWACVAAIRRSKPLFLIFAAPPVVMLGLHAAVANPSTRYNLILIGPFAAGTAWIIARMMSPARRQQATQQVGG
jgi:uncharacterized membrane protein (UPF0136 family)